MKFALLTLLLTACASAAPRATPADDIRARSAAIARAESAGDVAAALQIWTGTAVIHVEGAPALRGRTEIEQRYRMLFPSTVAFWSEPHEIRVAESGELAYELGTNHLTTRENDPLKIGIKQSTTKYLAIWTRGKDGQWRIDALSITNNP